MLTNNKPLCASLISVLVTTAPAVSAETLEEAWNSAIDNNHQIKAAKIDTSAAEEQLNSAKGQRLPELNVSSGYTQRSETPGAVTQIDGRTAQFNTQQPGNMDAQAIATLPIYTGGRISHDINAAEASLQAAQHNETTAQLDIKMQVAEAYIAVLRAESSLQVAKSHVDSLKAHVVDVNNLFDQGMVARNDVLAANVELVNAEQQVVQAGNRLDIAKASYNRLLDRNLEDEVKLVKQFPEMPKEDLKALNNDALKQRSELAVLTRQIESLEQQAQSVKAGVLPQVAINGGYQYQENRYQAAESMWLVNAGVKWKLFDGSTRHQSDAISRQAISLKEQRDDLTSAIGLQVRQAWLDYQEAQKRVAVTQQAIEQAEENMRVTTDSYQQGLSTNTDVLKAEDLRTTSHDNFNNANYDAAQAALRLRRAVGVL
ncbi:TolC family protein [Methylobacter sp. BlB1]|jgi:outer membrane protein TolC|uniref:TolC family protein n=1 Tax=Methylobacter sp. BlB1 TaxID=2785914 RepID=UPI0018931472|nr:TolC family protein [Methylobacter sp. BlB1]MBF6648698.1 TolC family protein [Methylobacter sp. BlB1]